MAITCGAYWGRAHGWLLGLTRVSFSWCNLVPSKSMSARLQVICRFIFCPLKAKKLPAFTQAYKGKGFDTVFSMGVLYHRLSPIDHLKELKSFIRKDGRIGVRNADH